MTSRAPVNSLFTRFGVELEYMLADAETLDVRPVADVLIQEIGGEGAEDVSRGRMEWSNELALHVIEIKTGRPAKRLSGLAGLFQGEVRLINEQLARRGLRLLPTAMHPWMDPLRETKLWPHGNQDIYSAFHRIFNCRGHGWGNLQSTHLNLPFAGEEEFVRLHAAIRLILPVLPALAASSPFAEGRRMPQLDYRLETYRSNCRRLPFLTGHVIPEPVRSVSDYHRRILNRIYRDLTPHDPEGILRHEWSNARGAIARFVRDTIEIRVLDIQECPAADLAVLQLIVLALQCLAGQSPSDFEEQRRFGTQELKRIFLETMELGDEAVVRSKRYLAALGIFGEKRLQARELWTALAERLIPDRVQWRKPVDHILSKGCLARRIIRAAGETPGRESLFETYRTLADCLQTGSLFDP